MKKFQFRLPLLAFLLAIAFSAFTSKDFESSKSMQTLHFFLIENGEPTEYLGDFDIAQSSDRLALEAASGCSNVTGICANGYTIMAPDKDSPVSEVWRKSN